MKKTIISVFFILFLLINFTFSQNILIKKYRIFSARNILKNSKNINLSSEQIKKLHNLLLNFLEKTIEMKSKIKINEIKFLYILKSQKIDRKKINSIIIKISELKTEYLIKYLNYFLDCRDVLNKKQKQTLINIRKHGR